MNIPKITQMAINAAISGGGGKREGTAIPVGEVIDRIYFNINNTPAETDEILSQLTYADIGLGEPVYLIYANATEGVAISAVKSEGAYVVMLTTNLTTMDSVILYMTVLDDGDQGYHNGWHKASRFKYNENGNLDITINSIGIGGAGQSDFMGVPVGAENEKLKNVLSITPF